LAVQAVYRAAMSAKAAQKTWLSGLAGRQEKPDALGTSIRV
jgi:hypothetical protein